MMKLKFALVIAGLFISSTRALAWYPVQAQCQVTPAQASCAVYNPNPFYIVCQGRTQGLTASGFPVWSGFNMPIAPGTYAYTYVYAANPWYDPFVNGGAEVWCQ